MVLLLGFISIFSPLAEENSQRMDVQVQQLNVDDYDAIEDANIDNPGILCECIYIHTLLTKSIILGGKIT